MPGGVVARPRVQVRGAAPSSSAVGSLRQWTGPGVVVGTWGPAICGHANDEVNDALRAALEKGRRSGPARTRTCSPRWCVMRCLPSEMVRFTNSGTRRAWACCDWSGHTGREKILGSRRYHGHATSFSCKRERRRRLGPPDSPGVPPGATQGTLAEYNNLASVEALLKEHECAAVVLEPVVGNSGFIPPTQEFLEG